MGQMVVWSWREGFYHGLRLEVVSVSFNKGNEPTLVQEHADATVLSSRLMRHLSLAIPDEHVGPNAHCQLDQSEVPQHKSTKDICRESTAGSVRVMMVLIGVIHWKIDIPDSGTEEGFVDLIQCLA